MLALASTTRVKSHLLPTAPNLFRRLVTIPQTSKALHRATSHKVILDVTKGAFYTGSQDFKGILSCGQAVEHLKTLSELNPTEPKIKSWALLHPIPTSVYVFNVKYRQFKEQTTIETARQIEAYINKGHSALKQPKNQ